MTDRRRSQLVGAMLGAATMAAVDEVVFHQMLGWHHFYDRSTPAVGLLSDGLLQTAYLALLVAGGFLFADLRRRRATFAPGVWAGFLLGAGAFQLFDQVMDHKVLRVHQVRYEVADLLPYDLAWTASAVVLLAAGAAMSLRAARR